MNSKIPPRYAGNTPYTIVIYDGPHYTDKILKKYDGVGSLDQIKAGVEVHIRQSVSASGRHWVDVMSGNTPVTHWNL